MAKVILTIEDFDDQTRMNLESDPPFPGPAATRQDWTWAQIAGLEALQAASKRLNGAEQSDA